MHPGFQQRLVVRRLCVVHHELIRAFRYIEFDAYATKCRAGHGLQQGFVRDEIRRAQHQPVFCVVDHLVEHAQVRLGTIARPRRDHLHDVGIMDAFRLGKGSRLGWCRLCESRRLRGWCRLCAVGLLFQVEHLIGFQIPVNRKYRFHRGDDRPGQLHHVINPLAPSAHVFSDPVAAINQVQRTHKTDLAIDDDDLAVIAQVRATKTPFPWLQRQHQMPVDANRVQAFTQLVVARVFHTTDLIKQQPHLHPAGDGVGKRLIKHVGGLIPGLDINLHVHVVGGGVDDFRHALDGLGIIGEQATLIANDGRKPRQAAIQGDHGRDFAGLAQMRRHIRQLLLGVVELRIGVFIHLVATPVDKRRAHQEKQRQAQKRDQQNR